MGKMEIALWETDFNESAQLNPEYKEYIRWGAWVQTPI